MVRDATPCFTSTVLLLCGRPAPAQADESCSDGLNCAAGGLFVDSKALATAGAVREDATHSADVFREPHPVAALGVSMSGHKQRAGHSQALCL
jgi:hypothetical protein